MHRTPEPPAGAPPPGPLPLARTLPVPPPAADRPELRPPTSPGDVAWSGQRQAASPDGRPRIGRFLVTRELGRGAMGIVVAAFDPQLARHVAIKVIDPRLANPAMLARFAREASAAGRLRHPGIVSVLEAGEDQGRPFLVMDLVEGETLEALLRREPRLPARRAVELALGVARALGHAHEQGVLHRDVKPANVLLDAQAQPRLADFGVARAGAADLTRTGDMLGTPEYMAPEQAGASAGAHGPASDVYALGATLYRMLVGRPPLQAQNLAGLLKMLLLERPTPPRALDPSIDPALDALVLRCLEKEPAARFRDGGQLAAALERWLVTPQTAAPRSPRLLLIGLGLLGAVALSTATFLLGRSGVGAPVAAVPAADAPPPPPSTAPPGTPPRDARGPAAPTTTGRLKHVRTFGHHGTRHPDLVSAIAVSGDRRSVLVGAAFYTPSNRRPGHLQLRDLESGHEQLAWRAHDNGVCDVAFTADGERALSCGLDGALRLWRLSVPPALLAEWAEGEPYRLLQLPGSPERFAVALLEGGVAEVVVEAERLEVRRRVALPRTTALALLSGGRVLAAHQSAERGHAVVDLATGEVDYLPSPAPHTYRLSASPDGGVVLDAHQHGLRVWDARTLALVRDQPLPHVAFRSLAWDEGGREAFVGSHHGTIGRWDAEALRWTPGWTQVNGGCWVLVGAGGRLLVGATGALRALDPTTGAEVTWPPGAPTLAVTAVAVARGSGTYVALHEDLREGARGDVWEAPSAERPRAVIRTGQQVVRGLSLDRAGRRAISAAAYSKDVLVWDLERPHRASAALQLTDLINYLSAAALSPDGGRVVTGSEDGKVHWWDPDLPTYPRGELPARRGWVSGLAFLDDERVVVASYGPPCLEVWHLTGGTAPVRVPLDEPPWVVACGERASEVFVGGMQGAVERRELPGGARLTRYSAHQRVVVSLDISDRGHLVSVSEDGTVKLSSVLTGDLLGVADLGPTGDRPTSAAFLPGGRVLLVGTARGVVHELEVGSR